MPDPMPYVMWSRDTAQDGSTMVWTHILTEEEVAYLIARDVKLADLGDMLNHNWLEKRLFFPFHRLEIRRAPADKGFIANVYETTESAAAAWCGIFQNNYNIKDRKGDNLIELYKSVIAEIQSHYDQYAQFCKEELNK